MTLTFDDPKAGFESSCSFGYEQHWFVKFARNKAGKSDQDILRSEFHYYRALHTLGIETVQAEGLALEEGSKPSLWMRRFDRRVTELGVERLAAI